MASGEHSYTRRAVLGAALSAAGAAGVGLGPGGGIAGDGAAEAERVREAWGLRLAALGRAEAEMLAAQARSSGPGRPFDVQWELDEAFSDRVVAFNRALRRLLRTPAPDLPALARKIALTVDHDVPTLEGCDPCLAALKSDASRLAELPAA